MIARVITIEGLPPSEDAARRCIESCAQFGVEAKVFQAVTPGSERFAAIGFPIDGFRDNPYSRQSPCIACFASHSELWSLAVTLGEPVLILEHDAIMVAPLPDLPDAAGVVNLGRPSYGRYRTLLSDGLWPLVSKPHFGGAHGYMVSPRGAERLIERWDEACPTDVYLHRDRFRWLQEWHPWPIHCDDSFSTIQRPAGCRAKHNAVAPLSWTW